MSWEEYACKGGTYGDGHALYSAFIFDYGFLCTTAYRCSLTSFFVFPNLLVCFAFYQCWGSGGARFGTYRLLSQYNYTFGVFLRYGFFIVVSCGFDIFRGSKFTLTFCCGLCRLLYFGSNLLLWQYVLRLYGLDTVESSCGSVECYFELCACYWLVYSLLRFGGHVWEN